MEQYFIDLSRVLTPGVGETPGYPPTIVDNFMIHETHGRANAKLSYNIHTATHVDVPFHFDPLGKKIDEMPLEYFYGPGIYLDLRSKMQPGIPFSLAAIKETMEAAGISEEDLTGSIVILHSGWGKNWGEDCYYKTNPYLAEDVANFFVKQKIKAVGLDFPVDGNLGSVIHPIHLKNEVLQLENMTNLEALQDLKQKSFNILAFPYKIYQQSGGPARIVAQVIK